MREIVDRKKLVKDTSPTHPPVTPGQALNEPTDDGPSDVKQIAVRANCPMSVRLEASDVEALTRILGSLAVAKEWAAEPGNTERQFAQILFNARKARARMFPASMFSEPAWDMLLALFIADEVPAAADLARWIDAPLTTAMRWLGYLEDHKLISRESSPADKRAHRIRLTDRARCNMQQLFSEVMSEWPLD